MNNIEDFMNATINNLKTFLNTQTVIGECIVAPDKSIIIPVSKISCGFVTGGGEYSETNPKSKVSDYPLAGGGGAGVSIKPLGFLVCNLGTQKILTFDGKGGDDKWGDIISTAINKIVKED